MRRWLVLLLVPAACGRPPDPWGADLAQVDLTAPDLAQADPSITGRQVDLAARSGTLRIGNDQQGPGNDTWYGDVLATFAVDVPAASLISFGYFPTNASMGLVTMVLYTDADNRPDKLVAATAATPIGAANEAQEMPPEEPTQLAGGRYWLGLMTSDEDFKPSYAMAQTDYYLVEHEYGTPPPVFPIGMAFTADVRWNFFVIVTPGQ